VAKSEAIRAGDRREAQRIFDKISDVNAKIAEVLPLVAAPAVKPALVFSIKISDFKGAAGVSNVVNLSGTDVSVTAETTTVARRRWSGKPSSRRRSRIV
jgi:hypothetical protein